MSKQDNNMESAVQLTAIEKLQNFFETNKNAILVGSLALVLVIVLGTYYKAFYMPKLEMEANNQMFNAQYYFEEDSFELALNSAGGFLEIAEEYSSTKAGNLAHYYAGVSYFKLGNYEEAINHLKSFRSKDDVVGALALGVLADAQLETGDTEASLKNYKKSVSTTNNKAVAPFLLKKAGIALELNGQRDAAHKYFNKIKDEFPESQFAQDIDQYIGRTL